MRCAVRRLLILPLMLVTAAVVFVLLPVVGVVQAVVAPGVAAGRRPRWRAVRRASSCCSRPAWRC
jgi:hypothetical protein